jgi:integrase
VPKKPGCPDHLTPITVGKAVKLYRAEATAGEWAPSTVATRMVCVNAFEEVVGADREAWLLTSHDFVEVLHSLLNGHNKAEVAARKEAGQKFRTGRTSKSSINSTRVSLRHFAAWMRDYSYINLDVTLPEPRFRSAKKAQISRGDHERIWAALAAEKNRIFPASEWPFLLDLAESVHPRLRMAVALGLYCGRRISEVVMLQWRHIDLTSDGRLLFFSVKTGEVLETPMHPGIEKELRWYKEWVTAHYGEPRPGWLLVPSRKFGSEITGLNSRMGIYADPATWPLEMTRVASTATINADVRKMLFKIGIGANEGTGTHTWRRSGAVFIADNFGLAAAQAFCGHKSRETTEGYTQNREGFRQLREGLQATPVREIPRVPAAPHLELLSWEEPAEVIDNVRQLRPRRKPFLVG